MLLILPDRFIYYLQKYQQRTMNVIQISRYSCAGWRTILGSKENFRALVLTVTNKKNKIITFKKRGRAITNCS